MTWEWGILFHFTLFSAKINIHEKPKSGGEREWKCAASLRRWSELMLFYNNAKKKLFKSSCKSISERATLSLLLLFYRHRRCALFVTLFINCSSFTI